MFHWYSVSISSYLWWREQIRKWKMQAPLHRIWPRSQAKIKRWTTNLLTCLRKRLFRSVGIIGAIPCSISPSHQNRSWQNNSDWACAVLSSVPFCRYKGEMRLMYDGKYGGKRWISFFWTSLSRNQDKLLILLGACCAAGHGILQPLFTIYFGRVRKTEEFWTTVLFIFTADELF